MEKGEIQLYGHTDICFEGEKLAYVISSGIQMETDVYYMPCLSFVENYGMNAEKEIESWDNEDHLLNILFKDVLTNWAVNKIVKNSEEFAALLAVTGVRLEDFQGLYKLFEKAIQRGMFDEQINKSTKI